MSKRPKRLDQAALQRYAGMLLAQRMMSTGELRQKLHLRAEEPADIDPLITQLTEYGALNDTRYAEVYAGLRKENQGFGQARVSRDLYKKRIAPGVAKSAIAVTYSGSDEMTMIEDYLLRKFRGKNLPEFLSETKNMANAFRRLRNAGYSAGNSLKVLRRYSEAAQSINEDDVESEDKD